MNEKEKLIDKVVREKTVDGKITCKTALGIAEEMDVPPKMVGKAANRLKVKIVACQLGCFK